MLDINFFIGMVNVLLIVLVPFVNYIFKKKLEKAAKENIENYGNFNKTFMDLYNNWENTKFFESIATQRIDLMKIIEITKIVL